MGSRSRVAPTESSETTLQSEMTSRAYQQMEEAERRNRHQAAANSFFDDTDTVTVASTHRRKLARVIVPKGKLTKKQFLRLNQLKMKKLFAEIDSNESGFISFAEFQEFLDVRFGVKPKPQVLQDLISLIDQNNDGQISEDEFIEFFELVQKLARSAREIKDAKWKAQCINGIQNFTAFGICLIVFVSGSMTANECEYMPSRRDVSGSNSIILHYSLLGAGWIINVSGTQSANAPNFSLLIILLDIHCYIPLLPATTFSLLTVPLCRKEKLRC